MRVNKTEHRKIEKLPPVQLYRKDLIALEKILKSKRIGKMAISKLILVMALKLYQFPHSLSYPKKTYQKSTNNISLKIIGWNSEREIENGVLMTLYHNYADYQIHALNEVWFVGKRSQINAFFQERKPWYAWLNIAMPALMPILSWVSLFIVFWGYRANLPSVIFLASTLFISVIFVGWMNFKQILFPYVKVFFSDKPNQKSNYELVTLILELAILIATIISIIVPLVINSK